MNSRPIQSPWEAVLLSVMVPGSGQFLAGKRLSGLAWLIFYAAGSFTFIWFMVSPRFASLKPAIWISVAMVALWFVMLVQAYRCLERGGARERHKPAIAGVLSALFPGVGQYYNHQWFMGFLFLVLGGGLLIASFVVSDAPDLPHALPVFLELLMALVSGAAVVHAYVTRSRRHAPIPFPVSTVLVVILAGVVLQEAAVLITRASVQAFKLPTASMEPTLQGVQLGAGGERHQEGLFQRARNFLARGERVVVIRARNGGTIDEEHRSLPDAYVFQVEGQPYRIPHDFSIHAQPGSNVEPGSIMATGMEKLGDHVLVNRLAYRLGKPRRGDVVVFATDGLDVPGVRETSYYIKRIAAVPGDKIAIRPPAVYINDKRLTEPKIFEDIAEGRNEYRGYSVARPLASPPAILKTAEDWYLMAEEEYFLLGDNSRDSLDSRYFGPILAKDIIGKVVRVYWPFDRAGVVP